MRVNFKTFQQKLEEYGAGTLTRDEFKHYHVAFGIYEQRADSLYMVRTRMPAGKVSANQLLNLSRISKTFGSGRLHISTRQELQIHEVPLLNLGTVVKELESIGLSPAGGGGNTVRNVMVSEFAGITKETEWDVSLIAEALSKRLLLEESSFDLPRKFKIIFTYENNPDSALWHDVGFVAVNNNGAKGFKLYGGGGLGRKPRLGVELESFVSIERVYETAEALKRLFHRLGDRTNRHSARLRYVVERLGEENFRNEYLTEIEKIRSEDLPPLSLSPDLISERFPSPIPDIDLKKAADFVIQQPIPGLYSIAIPVLLGDLSSQAAQTLAQTLAPYGDDVIRFTGEQNIRLRNIPGNAVPEIIKLLSGQFPLLNDSKLFLNQVACSGAETCRLGITNSREALLEVQNAIRDAKLNIDLLGALRLHFSGCPNCCGTHLAADIGFVGSKKRIEDIMIPYYAIYTGTTVTEKNISFASHLGELPARELPSFVVRLLKTMIDNSDLRDCKSSRLHEVIKNQLLNK